MFNAFETAADPRAARRLTVSAGAALCITIALFIGAKAISTAGPLLPKKKSVDVSFRPPPPPPPPAKIENAPKPKPKPPPPPKVAEAAPAPAPMVAPVEVPKKPLPEAEKPQVAAIKVAPGGTGSGVMPAEGGAPPSPPEEAESPAPQVAANGPMNLPEEAEPPEAEDDNAVPEYPEEARTAGQESVVILKVVIEKDGSVGRIQVMKGDEPFIAAALAAVKQWRYSPAQLEGQPIAVYRIVKIPFRLRS